ncbi:MAG: NUDIX domain-containing protein [Oscillospiraceae bacterium]|nr:NUDIX domain-containing protein [Oscillospiraceae bacterium]
MRDILFKTEDFVFSYRIAGVLVREGKALLQRSGGDYAFIGGHVSAMETSAETLVREFKEELGADIAVGRLLAVGEVFFPWGEKPCHQIGLYYEVRLPDGSRIPPDGVFHGYDELGGERIGLDFCWVPLSELEHIPLYPPQMAAHILSGSKELLHFVYKEM